MYIARVKRTSTRVWIILAAMLALVTIGSMGRAMADDGTANREQHMITIYDRGVEQTIISKARTVREALAQADVTVDAIDIVEPGLDEQLVAQHYNINVYRARPVIVEDGSTRIRTVTAAQSPAKIAKSAAITLYPEDSTELKRVDDVVSDGGAGLKLTVDRATPFIFVLYGKRLDTTRTQATTVGDMLKEKDVKLESADSTSVPLSTGIVAGMTVEVWRNGVQTMTQEEDIAMPVEQVKDQDRVIGFREIRTPGNPGKKQVTYEINMQNGLEVSRRVIQEVQTLAPEKQVEVIGVKNTGGGLTKSKGVNTFIDSKGVAHRETYYDLPMRTVMTNCGGGGVYAVRADGVKVDRDGYVIIAAHLARYPRCSIVETSLGLGKVYDTGGFTSVHPDGFDLATDWSKNDGV